MAARLAQAIAAPRMTSTSLAWRAVAQHYLPALSRSNTHVSIHQPGHHARRFVPRIQRMPQCRARGASSITCRSRCRSGRSGFAWYSR
jgi:hypothetical protein